MFKIFVAKWKEYSNKEISSELTVNQISVNSTIESCCLEKDIITKKFLFAIYITLDSLLLIISNNCFIAIKNYKLVNQFAFYNYKKKIKTKKG